MQADVLSGGFADPAIDAAHAFRSVMEAMARPGSIHNISDATPPAPLSAAATAVLLTLCDTDTTVHLAGHANCAPVRQWLAFHTGAPLKGPSHAMFAVGRWDALTPLASFPVGTSQYPDRRATLVVEVITLANAGATLSGPGIKDEATLALPEREAFQANQKLFPRGLDFIFTCGHQLAALPRTTEVR